MGGFKTTEVGSLTILEAKSLKSGCWQGWILLEALKEILFCVPLQPLVAANAVVLLGVQMCHCSFCLCLHTAFTSVSLSLKFPSAFLS